MSDQLNVLLLGSGGREAAIAWKLSQSPMLGKLFIAPGNAGTTACGTNIAIKPTDFDAVAKAVKEHDIDLVIAGNEDPLVKGLREALAVSCPGVPMVGPGADGAALEGSKDFAKDFMGRHNIPTARHLTATKENIAEARAASRLPTFSRPTASLPARAYSSSTISTRPSARSMKCSTANSVPPLQRL